jgi:hypothetical protein
MKKHCPKCQTSKELQEFSSNIRNPDGLAVYCRICNAEKQREWKHANKDKVKAWKARYREKCKQSA